MTPKQLAQKEAELAKLTDKIRAKGYSLETERSYRGSVSKFITFLCDRRWEDGTTACRTGSKETNTRIAMAARDLGMEWHPYGVGFADRNRKWMRPQCEEDVFKFVRLPYLEPWER